MSKNTYNESKIVAELLCPTMNAFSRLVQYGNVVPPGLTPQQIKIIMDFLPAGSVRLSDLSRCAAVTQGTMTGCAEVAQEGLLIRKKDPVNERACA